MVEYKLRPIDSYRRVSTSHTFDEDQMTGVMGRFFFALDVTKSECSIFDRMDGT